MIVGFQEQWEIRDCTFLLCVISLLFIFYSQNKEITKRRWIPNKNYTFKGENYGLGIFKSRVTNYQHSHLIPINCLQWKILIAYVFVATQELFFWLPCYMVVYTLIRKHTFMMLKIFLLYFILKYGAHFLKCYV